MADFNYVAKIIQPEGKIVYEYNPLYNYRPKHKNGDTIQDGEVHDMITKNSEEYGEQLNIFNVPKPSAISLEKTMDTIRRRYGKTAIIRANSLKKGGTFIERAGLVGGHSGGQSLE